jgi:hypothetical protein
MRGWRRADMGHFGDILNEFKGAEEPENIMPLLDDEILRNGVVAWKSVTITFKPLEECKYKDKNSRWNWLWTMVDYDVAHFGVVAGVKQQEAVSLVQRLIGLRLIYPDGTINVFAKKYMQSVIMAKIKKS